MSKYDLYRNTICKEDDNDYILLFKDEESAKNVYDEFNRKDQRIAELEKELASQNSNEVVKKKYDSLKEAIKFLWEKQITDEHIFYVIDQLGQQHIDRIQDIENGICKIERLEKELAELKENSIVPKFNFGDTIFAVVTYIDDPKDKTVIESGIVQKIECDKNQIKYWCDNGRIYWEDEYEKLFATEQEAQAKLKELEGE